MPLTVNETWGPIALQDTVEFRVYRDAVGTLQANFAYEIRRANDSKVVKRGALELVLTGPQRTNLQSFINTIAVVQANAAEGTT